MTSHTRDQSDVIVGSPAKKTRLTTTMIGRKWTTCDEDCAASRDGGSFSIATYNVLTDKCIPAGQYLYCPEQVRYMPARHLKIMAQIKEMDPDIVCFQEVDHAHYKTRLQPSMTGMGYDGILLQRLDDQGLATFWKNDRFELQQQKHVTLHHAAETYLQMADLEPNEMTVVRKAMERPEASLLVRLRHTGVDSMLAIANIHVTWSRLKYPALQALQISMAARELNEFVRGYQCSTIICGDFNSPPDSLPYQLMSRGHVDDDMTSSLRSSCTTNDQMERLRTVHLFDVLPPKAFTINTLFNSAYKTALGKEPQVTNCDDCGQLENITVHQLCLDYIWFDPRSLDVTGVLETPPGEELTKHYALPSVDFPSDHIPLMAQFRFRSGVV